MSLICCLMKGKEEEERLCGQHHNNNITLERARFEKKKKRKPGLRKKEGLAGCARIKRRKKRTLSTPARPSNRAFGRRNTILIQRIDLESTSRFGKPSTFAPRENFSLPLPASFPTRNASTHAREREKNERKKCPSQNDFFERPPERDVI